MKTLGFKEGSEAGFGSVERCRGGGEVDVDEAAHLMEGDGVEAEVGLAEAVVHAPPGGQGAIEAVAPLVVGADEGGDVSGVGVTEGGSAVAAHVVKRVEAAIAIACHDDGVRVDADDEVVAGLGNFAGVPGEEPAASPDPLEVELVDRRVVEIGLGEGPALSP